MKHISISSTKSGGALLLVIISLFILSSLSTLTLRNSLSLQSISQVQVEIVQRNLWEISSIESAAAMLNSGLTPAQVTALNPPYTLPNGYVVEHVVTQADPNVEEYEVDSVVNASDDSDADTIVDPDSLTIFRPSYFSYGIYYENFSGTWLPGDTIDASVWTGSSQSVFGYSTGTPGNPDYQLHGPVFSGKSETGASSFSGSPSFASIIRPGLFLEDYLADLDLASTDTERATVKSQYLRYWSTDSSGFDTGVTRPGLSTVDFSTVETAATTSSVTPALIDPGLVDLTTTLDNQVLYIEVDGGDILELSFNTENNAFGEDSGVINIKNGSDPTYKVYATSLDLIYVSKASSSSMDVHIVENIVDEHSQASIIAGTPDGIPDGIDDDGNVTNILRGNLSIYSEDDVMIYAGIEYDNEINDQFELLSADDLRITYNVAGTVDGVPDLELHGGYMAADVYAVNGDMNLQSYNNGVVRGELRVFGSRVAENSTPFGTFSGTSLTSGFLVDVDGDERFLSSPLPYTPIIPNKFVLE